MRRYRFARSAVRPRLGALPPNLTRRRQACIMLRSSLVTIIFGCRQLVAALRQLI